MNQITRGFLLLLSVVGCNVGDTATITISSSASSLELVKSLESEILSTFIIRIKHVNFMRNYSPDITRLTFTHLKFTDFLIMYEVLILNYLIHDNIANWYNIAA